MPVHSVVEAGSDRRCRSEIEARCRSEPDASRRSEIDATDYVAPYRNVRWRFHSERSWACGPPNQMKIGVVPAKAGTHCGLEQRWIPACAGMTSPGVIFSRAQREIFLRVFLPRFVSKQSEIPRCARNDSQFQRSPSCPSANRHPETMKMREAPWSAAAELRPSKPNERRQLALPHSKVPSAQSFSKQTERSGS